MASQITKQIATKMVRNRSLCLVSTLDPYAGTHPDFGGEVGDSED
jgi:hypothetical protein